MPNVSRLLGALALVTGAAGAQLPPDTLPLRDLSAFRAPGKWRVENAVLESL